MVKRFDKNNKLGFRSADEPLYIKFGSIRDNDPMLKIRSGQLKLLGYAFNNLDLECTISFLSSDVASFFEPSLQCIVKSIKEQCEASDNQISVRNLSGLRSCVLLTSPLKVCFPCGGFCCERLALSKFERCI